MRSIDDFDLTADSQYERVAFIIRSGGDDDFFGKSQFSDKPAPGRMWSLEISDHAFGLIAADIPQLTYHFIN